MNSWLGRLGRDFCLSAELDLDWIVDSCSCLYLALYTYYPENPKPASSKLRQMGLQMNEPSVVEYAFQHRFIEIAQSCLIADSPIGVTIGDTVEDWTFSKVTS